MRDSDSDSELLARAGDLVLEAMMHGDKDARALAMLASAGLTMRLRVPGWGAVAMGTDFGFDHASGEQHKARLAAMIADYDQRLRAALGTGTSAPDAAAGAGEAGTQLNGQTPVDHK